VAAQAQVSMGMLSLIETGKRRPSLRSWERIRGALGISEPLPQETWRARRGRSRMSWWLRLAPAWLPHAGDTG
jgi:transcriptional regulator with XRE-family HTH domain